MVAEAQWGGFERCGARNSLQSCPSNRTAVAGLWHKLDVLIPGFPREAREAPVLTHYQEGGYYDLHLDGRPVTVLVYLSEGGEGGDTFFPRLGLRVAPELGLALL